MKTFVEEITGFWGGGVSWNQSEEPQLEGNVFGTHIFIKKIRDTTTSLRSIDYNYVQHKVPRFGVRLA